MHILKQSTAVTVLVGPLLDSTGAAVTGAVIGDFNITKNGTTAALASAATATHSHNGHYLIALTTGNTDTLGRLSISANNSAHAMAVFRFQVLPSSVFDLFGTATNATGGFPAATGTISTLAGAISTIDAVGVRSAVGMASANLDTQLADLPTVSEFTARTLAAAEYATATALATVDGVVDAILVDTDTTIPNLIADVPTVSEFNARTLPAADYATASALAVVDGVADAILVDTDATIPGLIADVPTVSEFNARTIVSADYATATGLNAVKLAADGLDSISATPPTGVAANFRDKILQVWEWCFGKKEQDTGDGTIKLLQGTGSTAAVTQTYSTTVDRTTINRGV